MPSSAMETRRQPRTADTPEDALREAIVERDYYAERLAACDRFIAEQSRIYADERGLTLRPTIEQLRRDLGCWRKATRCQ